jgi:hypothetical protein
MATTTSSKPTSRQLTYLKSLANRTGQTFTYPKTSRQASAEINRLKHAKPSSRTERSVERKLIADQIAPAPWTPPAFATTRSTAAAAPPPGCTTESRNPRPSRTQGRPYRAGAARPSSASGPSWPATPSPKASGSSTAKRVDGIVRVTDRPASQGGRAYLVERGLETQSELDALIADYLQQATKLATPPLAICPLEVNA